jgi:hypothetical protein
LKIKVIYSRAGIDNGIRYVVIAANKVQIVAQGSTYDSMTVNSTTGGETGAVDEETKRKLLIIRKRQKIQHTFDFDKAIDF